MKKTRLLLSVLSLSTILPTILVACKKNQTQQTWYSNTKKAVEESDLLNQVEKEQFSKQLSETEKLKADTAKYESVKKQFETNFVNLLLQRKEETFKSLSVIRQYSFLDPNFEPNSIIDLFSNISEVNTSNKIDTKVNAFIDSFIKKTTDLLNESEVGIIKLTEGDSSRDLYTIVNKFNILFVDQNVLTKKEDNTFNFNLKISEQKSITKDYPRARNLEEENVKNLGDFYKQTNNTDAKRIDKNLVASAVSQDVILYENHEIVDEPDLTEEETADSLPEIKLSNLFNEEFFRTHALAYISADPSVIRNGQNSFIVSYLVNWEYKNHEFIRKENHYITTPQANITINNFDNNKTQQFIINDLGGLYLIIDKEDIGKFKSFFNFPKQKETQPQS
ncbi:hypothetical protein [Mycoplasma struthionis]|uniref:Lipoprotein n=1 Tax=Mycoplasma struthionis TaxID=538220 RepID=A0A3G8LIR8_9MOLU|nr:hypothetical protein [Mycoplasma struthionis]AZG68558.1 hypothetical protein EGN60_01040 [Mycoplasma struthionis]